MARKNTRTATATGVDQTVVATIPAPGVDRRWRVTALSISCNAGGALFTLSSGSTVFWQASITSGGPLHLADVDIQAATANEDLIASMATPGAGNRATVSIAAVLDE